MNIKVLSRNLIYGWISLLLLGSSVLPPADKVEQVRAFTRMDEFDFIEWTLNAFFVKAAGIATLSGALQTDEDQEKLVLNYINLVEKIDKVDGRIEQIYSDPNVTDPRVESAPDVQELNMLMEKYRNISPLSENILERQTSVVLKDMGITFAGQPLPAVLYHITPMPKCLIISPRDQIQQDVNVSLQADLTLEQMVGMETDVEKSLNVSALVVNVGGVGTYPTMVMSTTDLPYLTDVIAHEWTHNYLTIHPLGLNYETNPELRTMNETTASIAGTEISKKVLAKFYPDKLPPPPQPPTPSQEGNIKPETAKDPAQFDFRKEMHATRVRADELLTAGRIEEAEKYMEEQRQIFWKNGYQIRRLNQAYFAFHGAYADEPGGAAGNDPVGPAVRQLRKQSTDLAQFLSRISMMTSFGELQKAIQ